MERKLTSPKRRLQWFLRFINAHIHSMDDREVLNLWFELREIAYGSLGLLAITDHELRNWQEMRQRAREIQDFLRDILEKVLTTSKKPKPVMIKPVSKWDEEEEEAVDDLDERGMLNFGSALGSIISRQLLKEPFSKWIGNFRALTYPLEMNVLTDGDKVITFFSKPEEMLLLEFVPLLSQFSLSSIRRCQREDCGAYFLKATQKEKHYCSNKCAWVMASRHRRNTNLEKEREDKRESYYRSVKRKHPNAKIQKRKRKEG